ncbi:MAG: hypothetical protein HS109_19815 [Burkholderiales bacterium]|nr:hypothetical protein [Burkholderiales bacterium]MCE7875839.1 hypothetical protein [Betaproteobacteria bacterium PRO3]
MAGEAARLIVLVAACAAASYGHAQEFVVRGGCRDGSPHGIYELANAGGRVRAIGAFNLGKRTSSFLFWSPVGVRVAQIPYDEGVVSGTVALWYANAPPGGDAPWKLQASFSNGALDGPKRSWFPDGRLRGDYQYRRGTLVAAKAWTSAGAPLSEVAARAQAVKDLDDDARTYAALDAVVNAHLPHCAGETGTIPQ